MSNDTLSNVAKIADAFESSYFDSVALSPQQVNDWYIPPSAEFQNKLATASLSFIYVGERGGGKTHIGRAFRHENVRRYYYPIKESATEEEVMRGLLSSFCAVFNGVKRFTEILRSIPVVCNYVPGQDTKTSDYARQAIQVQEMLSDNDSTRRKLVFVDNIPQGESTAPVLNRIREMNNSFRENSVPIHIVCLLTPGALTIALRDPLSGAKLKRATHAIDGSIYFERHKLQQVGIEQADIEQVALRSMLDNRLKFVSSDAVSLETVQSLMPGFKESDPSGAFNHFWHNCGGNPRASLELINEIIAWCSRSVADYQSDEPGDDGKNQ